MIDQVEHRRRVASREILQQLRIGFAEGIIVPLRLLLDARHAVAAIIPGLILPLVTGGSLTINGVFTA